MKISHPFYFAAAGGGGGAIDPAEVLNDDPEDVLAAEQAVEEQEAAAAQAALDQQAEATRQAEEDAAFEARAARLGLVKKSDIPAPVAQPTQQASTAEKSDAELAAEKVLGPGADIASVAKANVVKRLGYEDASLEFAEENRLLMAIQVQEMRIQSERSTTQHAEQIQALRDIQELPLVEAQFAALGEDVVPAAKHFSVAQKEARKISSDPAAQIWIATALSIGIERLNRGQIKVDAKVDDVPAVTVRTLTNPTAEVGAPVIAGGITLRGDEAKNFANWKGNWYPGQTTTAAMIKEYREL